MSSYTAMSSGSTNGTDDTSNVVATLNHFLNTTWYERKPVNDPPTQAQRTYLGRAADLRKRGTCGQRRLGWPPRCGWYGA